MQTQHVHPTLIHMSSGRHSLVAAAAISATVVTPVAFGQVTIETVTVADPANATDSSGLGAVARRFRVGRFEVTNDQYVAFLSAVAASDPNGLFNELMTTSDRGGIIRSGVPGSFTYQPKPDFSDKPVGSVSWFDAARFCNWLHHGRPAGPQGPGTTDVPDSQAFGNFRLSLEHRWQVI